MTDMKKAAPGSVANSNTRSQYTSTSKSAGANSKSGNANSSHTVIRNFENIKTEPVEWLWPSRIATKLNLIGGHPGMGKSQITIDIAARVSAGRPWPDGQPCHQGSVIFISNEDDASDTIKPRLEAAEAKVSRIHIIDGMTKNSGVTRSWELADYEPLARTIMEIGDVRLIVIDPITAYLGGKDGHNGSCLLYTSPSPRDLSTSRMPSSA